MKEKIFAWVLLAVTVISVIVNTVILQIRITKLIEDAESLEISEDNAKEAASSAREMYSHFKKDETYISITVNHDDLTNIEGAYAELIGYLTVGDSDGANVTKIRLIDSLEHLRRLSGFNIDAII